MITMHVYVCGLVEWQCLHLDSLYTLSVLVLLCKAEKEHMRLIGSCREYPLIEPPVWQDAVF